MHDPADGYSPRSVRKHAQAGATIKRLQLRLKGGEDGNPGLTSRNTEWFSDT